MNVLQWLLILLPGVAATQYYVYIPKSNPGTYKIMIMYVWMTLAILWLNAVILYLRGWGEFDFSSISVQFIMKYVPLNAVLSFLVPWIFRGVAMRMKRKS